MNRFERRVKAAGLKQLARHLYDDMLDASNSEEGVSAWKMLDIQRDDVMAELEALPHEN